MRHRHHFKFWSNHIWRIKRSENLRTFYFVLYNHDIIILRWSNYVTWENKILVWWFASYLSSKDFTFRMDYKLGCYLLPSWLSYLLILNKIVWYFPSRRGTTGLHRERYHYKASVCKKYAPKSGGNCEAWGWHGSNPPWELSELGGEISELQVIESAEMRTSWPVLRATSAMVWIDFWVCGFF